jgi:hypothetical protein
MFGAEISARELTGGKGKGVGKYDGLTYHQFGTRVGVGGGQERTATEQQPKLRENDAQWHSSKAGRRGSGWRAALGQVGCCSGLAWDGGGMEEGLGVGVASCSRGDCRQCPVLLGWEPRKKKKRGGRGRSSGRCFVEGCGEARQSGWDGMVRWGGAGIVHGDPIRIRGNKI